MGSTTGLRATIRQIEKYNGAVNTFNIKFGGLPGDLNVANASAFSLTAAAGSTGRGDGNGMIDGIVAGTTGQYAWTQEGCLFWTHLSQAGLVEGSFTQACDRASPMVVSAATVSLVLPISRLNKNNSVNVGSAGGLNYYMIGGFTGATAAGAITSTTNLTPMDGYSMDSKMDDGAPLTGLVQAHATAGSSVTAFTDPPSASSTAGTGMCLVGDMVGTAQTDTYNRLSSSGGTSLACEIRFRFN